MTGSIEFYQRLAIEIFGEDRDLISGLHVHHSATPADEWNGIHTLQAIRQNHLGQGWDDIGYHYLIDPQGRRWPGRPVWLVPSSIKGHNKAKFQHPLAVCAIGDFRPGHDRLGEYQLEALDDIVGAILFGLCLPPSSIHRHKDLAATACPGEIDLDACVKRVTPGWIATRPAP